MTGDYAEDDDLRFLSLGGDFFEASLSNDGDSYVEAIFFSFKDRFALNFVALFGREQNEWHSRQQKVRHFNVTFCEPRHQHLSQIYPV